MLFAKRCLLTLPTAGKTVILAFFLLLFFQNLWFYLAKPMFLLNETYGFGL